MTPPAGRRVVLFGAGGAIGRAIAGELLRRGHTVTGVSRTGVADGIDHPRFSRLAGDATDPASVASRAAGHDVVASAVGPGPADDDHAIIVGAAKALVAGTRSAEVRRLVVVGGAGSLTTAAGVSLVDSPGFPAMWRANALAQSEALALYRTVDDLDWTFVSPAAHLEDGKRTGVHRVGGDRLLTDAAGVSRISRADYAAGFVDELERGLAVRRRITLAY